MNAIKSQSERAIRYIADQYVVRRVSATGLVVFRICYSLVLLAEVYQLYRFRHLIFDPVPHLARSEISFDFVLAAWAIVLVCIAVGFMTRTACIVNYLMTLLTFGTFTAFEYHIDYIFTSVNVLLPFMPLAASFSLDRLIERNTSPTRPRVPVGFYFAILLVGLGLPYFDSAIYKLGSPMWRSGLGLWLPASLPHNVVSAPTWILDQYWLVTLLGYFTIVFELLFLFLIWFRICRIPLTIVGIGLHAGIVFIFPIPLFGLALLCMYPLLWQLAFRDESPESEASAVQGLGIVGYQTQAVMGLTVAIVILQFALTAQTPLAKQTAKSIAGGSKLQSVVRKFTAFTDWSGPLLGVKPHSVFMDNHFDGFEHEVSLEYVPHVGEAERLPIYRPNGNATGYSTGRVWVNWTFRVCGPTIDEKRLRDGLRKYSAFWAHENGVSLDDAQFAVLARCVEVPTAWEKGFAQVQNEKPWYRVGRVEWKQAECEIRVADLEALTDEQAVTLHGTF